ncbi:MAG: MerR family transcriptional regulator [Syntrophales bacterium]|jgi:DNA-binding transcriptional MerR regulator|nr:MerR family transcriptional regulator [Syntrophales bacterium]MDY0044180.1 MerR family transcriptional regulator [Syntrophales bacterium]
MSELIPDKSYFRIGEVSKLLGVEPYVVRYWESEFRTVKPIRTKSYQRLYRRKDVQELMKIKSLLYKDKYTIAGAKKKLSTNSQIPAPVEGYLEVLDEIKKELRMIRALMR